MFRTVNILYIAKEQGYISDNERDVFYEEAEKLIIKIRAFKNALSKDD